AQIVAEVLGVDVEQVHVITGDTREFHWGTGTFASRGAVVAGSACHAAALAVREKVLELASRHLEAAREDLELAGGRVRGRGGTGGAGAVRGWGTGRATAASRMASATRSTSSSCTTRAGSS